MSNDFLEKGIEHQIILVDNDFPDDLEKILLNMWLKDLVRKIKKVTK